MTVRHLQSLRRVQVTGNARAQLREPRGRRQGHPAGPNACPSRLFLGPAAALSADPAVLGKYRAGFNECLAEVDRFLAGCEGVPADVRARLLGHLAACLGQLEPSRRPAPPPPAAEACAPELPAGPCPLRRPGTVFALLLPPGRSGALAAARGAGTQSQGAPWRPWLR
ncbi:Transcription factor HES-4 [Galemys pyrenaicus]|uniref:Transcription factor HES-4 n=1 Tax=Galemys pyrenaicus TaxID=202257 RepID=A0A8J5ZQ32_GALPY|nr:Transcription factor HES-4 [Galemys pyrenaicus]